MIDGEIKEAFLTLAQSMTFQTNVITSQFKSMTVQMNRDIGPWVPQHVNTMSSHLRDFTRMNPPMFYRSRSDEDPQDLLNEVYNIHYAMDVTFIE